MWTEMTDPEQMAREVMNKIPADCDPKYEHLTIEVITTALREYGEARVEQARIDWAHLAGSFHVCEAKAKEARRAALEEAAKLTENMPGSNNMRYLLAEAIRALLPPEEVGTKEPFCNTCQDSGGVEFGDQDDQGGSHIEECPDCHGLTKPPPAGGDRP